MNVTLLHIYILHLVPHSGHFGDVGCVSLLSTMTIAYWVICTIPAYNPYYLDDVELHNHISTIST